MELFLTLLYSQFSHPSKRTEILRLKKKKWSRRKIQQLGHGHGSLLHECLSSNIKYYRFIYICNKN